MDWVQLWQIITLPDNIPIILLLVLVPFYTIYGLREAKKNDDLITRLEADPKLAKTHHRRHQPYKEGWDKAVHVWPYLLRIEFLACIIVTVLLIVWSVGLDAPLEEPANPSLTMNPSKAPWYFLGLQEMLVYFDPWIAGVILPSLIIFGLMAIPYCDVSPLGNGYYTYKQRKFSLWFYFIGFHVLWVGMIAIGTLIRGPGWMWFWPGMFWDHHRVIHEYNLNLHEFLGMKDGTAAAFLFGGFIVTLYFVGGALLIHKLYLKYKKNLFERMNTFQYITMVFLLLTMFSLPAKMVLRLAFSVKYVWVTPWFNI